MVLPQSGNPISLLNLLLEYDDTEPTSLNEFYGEANAPASGTIDLADFYASAATAAVTTNLLFELDARDTNSWPGSGSTWYDTTSNSYDFTLVNGPTDAGTSPDAVDFDGTNDYAEISDGTWIPDGTNAWTCEVYIYVDDWDPNSFNGSERLMFSKTSPSNQGMSLGFDEQSNGDLHMIAGTQGGGNVSGGTHYYNMGAATNYENTWFHAVWTYDGSNLTYYIDGSQVATWSGRNFHSNTAPLRLMCFDPSNSSYSMNVNGKLAVVRMYSSALSSSNVTTNRANCTGGAAASDSVLTVTPTSHSGSAFTATFTFDQRVALFDINDITVSGGTKGTFTAQSGRKVYTLVITPSGNSTVTITVPESASFNSASLDNNAINLAVTYETFTTSGLVCRLNANDSNSYGGSGSTWTDVSTAGNNGTIYGATFVNGTNVDYFDFDGSNDYVEVTRMIGASSFSLAAWINTSSQTGSGGSGNFWNGYGVIDTEQGGSGDFGLVVKDGSAGFGIGNNTTIWSNPSNHPVTDGAWHYIVGTRNASTGEIVLYVDGSQAAQNSTAGGTNALTDTSTIRIGRTYSGARYYTGKIAAIHIYDDVFTSTEVSTNYNDTVAIYSTPEVTLGGSSHSNAQFTLTFTWNVDVTGFTTGDITVTNATKGTFSGSGKTYTLVLTPSGTSTINVSIPANAVTRDGGSEQNSAFSGNITYSAFPTNGLLLNLDAGASGAVSGTSWYDQASSNDATLYNGAAYSSTKGGCIEFDGSNDYAETGSTNLNSISSAISFGGMFQFDSQPSSEMAFMRPTSDFFQLGLTSSNRIRNLISGPAWTGSNDVTYTFGTNWTYMMVTYDSAASGNRLKFYINGSLNSSFSASGNINSNTNSIKIGEWYSNFDGRIMCLQVWNRALTTSEITAVWNECNGR